MYLITWITTHLPTPEGWMAEWAMLACWLTDSGRFNRKVVTHPTSSLAQDRESSLAETSVLTTMLCSQPTSNLNGTLRAKQRFGWGKFFKCYLYIEYLSQLNSFGPPNCTHHRMLGAVCRTAPIIIVFSNFGELYCECHEF